MYILSGLHKVTNIISKKTNYKGQNVTKPQLVFLYNRYMSGVDLTDQFYSTTVSSTRNIQTAKKCIGSSG